MQCVELPERLLLEQHVLRARPVDRLRDGRRRVRSGMLLALQHVLWLSVCRQLLAVYVRRVR
jgi:hypothetical protein